MNGAIASIVYTVLRIYRMSLGEPGGPAWEAAPAATKDKVLREVEFVRTTADVTPEDMHKRWATKKLIDGWSAGAYKSELLKTHPRLDVPFDRLPRDQQAKASLFLVLVKVLAPLAMAVDKAEDAVQQMAQQSELEQTGALLYIAAMVNRFGGETGIVQLTKADMEAALAVELMRHDTDDGLILKVERPPAPAVSQVAGKVALDTTLPAGG